HRPNSMPPATAGPSIAAMTGLSNSSREGPKGPRGISPPLPRGPAGGMSSSPSGYSESRVLTNLRSQPAQNAPPARHKRLPPKRSYRHQIRERLPSTRLHFGGPSHFGLPVGRE